jgi:chromosome segregation protein
MHIKKISVRNFKSFSKRVDIPIYEGFTVISGPNGSGKSNIIDSVLFCLGLSHSAKLRAERLTDLIYSGNGKVDDAEVSIVFDNKDSTIPAESEIIVTRKIRMTEKGYYSYYYINGKSSNLSEVHRLLSHAGIYGDTYNVIMQGDVTRITEMTPLQRRKIIDDIAGISEFDEKKEKAIEELEKVRENMDRIETILMEVSSRLQQLEKDRSEAMKYKSLIEEKDRNQMYLRAHRYKNLLTRKNRLRNEIEKIEKQKDSESQRLIETGNSIQKLTSMAEEVSHKISERADEEFQKIQNKIVEINSEIEGIKKSERFYRNELSKLKDGKTNALITISKLKDELEVIENELD